MRYDKTLLKHITKENSEYFTSVSIWNSYAGKHQLPRARTFAYHFGSWNIAKKEIFGDNVPVGARFEPSFTEEELIQIAKEHSSYFQKQKDWNFFASEKDLPSSKVYMHKFNGWNEAKIKIFGSERPLFRNLYTKEQLVMIARKHSTYFTSQNTWSRYAAQHGLPNAHVFINHFNSWNEAKASIFQESKAVLQQKRSFSKENLIETAKKYQDHFTSIKAWDSFAVQHDLPRSGVFIKHFQSWNHAKKQIFNDAAAILKRQSIRKYSSDQLIGIALKHFNHFNLKISEWNHYAKDHQLPTGSTFCIHFGTWETAQEVVRSAKDNRK